MYRHGHSPFYRDRGRLPGKQVAQERPLIFVTFMDKNIIPSPPTDFNRNRRSFALFRGIWLPLAGGKRIIKISVGSAPRVWPRRLPKIVCKRAGSRGGSSAPAIAVRPDGPESMQGGFADEEQSSTFF
ncbi:hypothetical protein HMPREF0262_02069 [Clostridium sp. ATCC 29733]|nr:hypothetical protein HMPREF0262_02069 [Clostridium sp. ATCC 29733]